VALYDYRCSQCGLEFEVSRPISQATDPARCPVDGAESARIFTMPMTFSKKDFRGPSTSAGSPSGWTHDGHSHGAGIARHTHRGPR
jgi:putative FmdB family regulatory protein